MDESLARALREAWAKVKERYLAYELLMPGDPSFICLTERCPQHCCRPFSVSLGERERARMERTSGLPARAFLECDETGEPILLPLAQPYLLARRDGACALLGEHMLCGQYEGRPDACRLYPHFILAFDGPTMRPLHDDLPRIRAAVARLDDGAFDAHTPAVLVRHLQCPGFGGPSLPEHEWRSLLRETLALQYPLDLVVGTTEQDSGREPLPPGDTVGAHTNAEH